MFGILGNAKLISVEMSLVYSGCLMEMMSILMMITIMTVIVIFGEGRQIKNLGWDSHKGIAMAHLKKYIKPWL